MGLKQYHKLLKLTEENNELLWPILNQNSLPHKPDLFVYKHSFKSYNAYIQLILLSFEK